MIQRVQTLYLLVGFLLISAMINMPLLQLMADNGDLFYFKSYGVVSAGEDSVNIYMTWPLVIMFVVIALISLVSIFLYKNRVLQIRLIIYNMILLVGLIGMIFFFYTTFTNEFGVVKKTLEIAVTFPLVALIVNYLALRNIRKDEAIIRSMDRLR